MGGVQRAASVSGIIVANDRRKPHAMQCSQIKTRTQKITYYPKGGKIEPTTGHTIYFLDFMRMILVIFREMHNLHHLIKCLFYYEHLIRSKDDTE